MPKEGLKAEMLLQLHFLVLITSFANLPSYRLKSYFITSIIINNSYVVHNQY